MATQISGLPDKIMMTHKGHRKYQLEQYMGGEAWKFTQGEDFKCRPASFGTQLMKFAKSKGLTSSTRVRGIHLLFQVTGAIDKEE